MATQDEKMNEVPQKETTEKVTEETVSEQAQETPANNENEEAAPSEEKPAEPVVEEKPAEPVVEEKPAEPVVEEKPAEPTAEQLLAEANDRYLRLRAEFDNYRKRMAREAMETRESAKCSTVTEILDVYDFFLLAMSHADKTDDMNAIKEGMKMIFNEFSKAFERLGVKMLDAVGKEFDSKFHEAVSQASSDTVPEGKIIQQWKHGFMIGDRLLRPATVVVSSGPEKKDEAAEAQAPAAE